VSTGAPDGSASSDRRTLLFGQLFYGLRNAGLKVGPTEWMSLMQVLSQGVVRPDLTDFYRVARAILIKHEAHYDTWDQVFLGVFGDGLLPTAAAEELLEWLTNPIQMPELSAEQIAALEALPLDELRKLFEQRLEEQKERHDGGNRWVGTGGTSPFGHGGRNPAGVRVGGSGGGRTAIQVAMERRFADYRSDRILDTRQIAVALKKLRRLSRNEGEPELDIDGSIDKTCQNAGMLTLEFQPPRKNQARVCLLMDVGGSMTPYARLVERLFSAAKNQNHWKKLEHFYFHNCPYSRLYESMRNSKSILTGDVLKTRPPETYLVIVGDASMAPSELVSRHGAIDYNERNETPGIVWLHRLRSHFTRAVWLNVMPPEHWNGYTCEVIGKLFPMYPLSVSGLGDAMGDLMRHNRPPVEPLDPGLVRDLW
jgi:uncharacterized protein with von Willebrand factor type A (vWA) domain